jgi:hypothetical protein
MTGQWPPALPSRDDVREDERAAYDSVVERQTAYGYADFVKRFRHPDVLTAFPGDRVQPYFAALLNSPLIAAGMSDLGAVYRRAGEYEGAMRHVDREWVDVVMSDELGINWVPYVHAADAAAVGVRPEAILAVVQGREDDLTEDERQLAEFIRAVARGTMTRELYQAVEQRVGVRAAVELTAFCGHLMKTTRLMQAWGIPDISKQQLEEFVQAIVDGEVELPQHARVPVK